MINNFQEEKYCESIISSMEENINTGKYRYALNDARVILEHYLKIFSEELNLSTSSDNTKTDSSTMIDSLKEIDFFDERECSTFHALRKISNKGSHSEYFDISLEDAKNALYYSQKVFEIVKRKFNIETNDYKYNYPISNPDYYTPNRRTYGKWSGCYSRFDLEIIPEYIELKAKADNGDINAMLDIAVGFLPKKIHWNENELINMPPYRYREREYFVDYSYDTRYYYWINKACATALEKDENNEFYSKRYIATALLEAIKFRLYTICEQKDYCAGIDDTYNQFSHQYEHKMILKNQYELICNIYGENVFHSLSVFKLFGLLNKILKENNYDFSIISSIHSESNLLRIKYLLYCYAYYYQNRYYYYDNKSSYYLITEQAIKPEEANIEITKDIMLKYTDDEICKRSFDYINKYAINARYQNMPKEPTKQEPITKEGKMVIAIILVVILIIYSVSFVKNSYRKRQMEATLSNPIESVEEVQNADFDYVLKILNENGIFPDKCYYEEGNSFFFGGHYETIVFFDETESGCIECKFDNYYITPKNVLYVEYNDKSDLITSTYNSEEDYFRVTQITSSNLIFTEIELND